MKPWKHWTPEEDAILLAASPETTCLELMPLLPGRDKRAIERRRRALGRETVIRLWTLEEDEKLLHWLGLGMTMRRIADELGRTEAAIRTREAVLTKDTGWVPPKRDPWADLPANAFEDIKVSADPAIQLSKPQDRTLAGVGTQMLVG